MMRFEDPDRSGYYDDNFTQAPRPEGAEPQSYYSGRRCTPMGAPKRSKRRGAILTAVLVLVILAGAAFGTVQLMNRMDVRLERTDGGFDFSVRAKTGGTQQNLTSRSDDQNTTAQTPQENAASTETEEAEAPQTTAAQNTASDAQTPQTTPELEVQPAQRGTENVTSSAEGALSLQEIYQKLNPSVVSIVSTLKSGTATGTGIIMSESGYIITNHHVIENASQLTVLTYDDRQYTASLVGSDAISDLAVLQIEASGLTAAQFGDSDALRVGDAVVAIGDPLGIQLRGTMTSGIISAIDRDLTVEDRKMTLIQTDAALNSGNSGGPLINCYGQVIGINTMKMSSYYSSASVEGLGFAIPISVAKPIIDELIENGYVAGRPAIGINGESMPEYARLYYRLPKGVYITYVSERSDAYLKGIRENDILTAVNGTAVSSLDEVNTIKNQFAAGDKLTLTIYRDGSYYDVEVTLMDQALQ